MHFCVWGSALSLLCSEQKGIVVGGIGVGGAHGSEDVRIAKAGLKILEKIKL